MKKFLTIVLLLVGCSNLAQVTPDPSKQQAQALIDQYYALDSKTSAGISYVNYSKELGDLKVSLDKFERNNPTSSAIAPLKTVFQYYADGQTVWDFCINHCNDFASEGIGSVILLKRIPDDDKPITNMSTLIPKYNPKTYEVNFLGDTSINLAPSKFIGTTQSDVLTVIWGKAKQDLQKIQQLTK
jgi:hypothetical protein